MPQCEHPLQTLHAHSPHAQRINTPIELIQLELQFVQFELQFVQQQLQFFELQLIRQQCQQLGQRRVGGQQLAPLQQRRTLIGRRIRGGKLPNALWSGC